MCLGFPKFPRFFCSHLDSCLDFISRTAVLKKDRGRNQVVKITAQCPYKRDNSKIENKSDSSGINTMAVQCAL